MTPMESIKLSVQTDHKFLTRASIFLWLRHQCENPQLRRIGLCEQPLVREQVLGGVTGIWFLSHASEEKITFAAPDSGGGYGRGCERDASSMSRTCSPARKT